MFKFENGEILRDTITGFKGVCMVRSEYLTGCIKYGLQAKRVEKDGKVSEWVFFDEMTLERVKAKPVPKKPSMGGPAPLTPH